MPKGVDNLNVCAIAPETLYERSLTAWSNASFHGLLNAILIKY